MAEIPDLGARLISYELAHPDPDFVSALCDDLRVDRPPAVVAGPKPSCRAIIGTQRGARVLT